MLPNLGIIAGSGSLPFEIANTYSGKCFIAGIKGEVDLHQIQHYSHELFSIGLAGKIIDYFKQNQVNNILLIGGIDRPNLKTLKVDFVGSKMVTKILAQKLLGTDNILKTVANFIESYDFKVISPLEIMEFTNYKIKNSPSKQDFIDIEIGKNVLRSLGYCDVGQAVIVYNGYVLGIEAAEGTDQLIRRCSTLRDKDRGGVLVKISKSLQDLRLDIPTIGATTIDHLYKCGFNGVAVEKNKVLISNAQTVVNILNHNKMFLHYVV